MLEAGVEFYEVKVDSVSDDNLWGNQPESVTLHSKATIIDGEIIFIGSLNFDPRSTDINTEMGIFVESATAGGGFRNSVMRGLARMTWKVDLDKQGRLRWSFDDGEQRLVTDREPQASWWRRFQVGFYRLLPIEDQL